MEAGAPQLRLLDTRVLWSPERRGGARGGGCGRDTGCGGEAALVVGPRGGGAGGPSLGRLQVGTDIWRICCHGNREIWKRGAEGGAEDASQSPSQAAITMTTSTILGRGRRGGVSDGRVGAWQAGRAGRAEEGVES